MNSPNSKVLVVDDDPTMLRMLSRWLEKGGYTPSVASDGIQALAMIEADCPDEVCILMGEKHKLGETIVCLPNRVMVEIVGDAGEGADADAVAS